VYQFYVEGFVCRITCLWCISSNNSYSSFLLCRWNCYFWGEHCG